MHIVRCPENPIITPGIFDWRKAAVYNPGAIYDNGKFYVLERASDSLRPHRCWIGLLSSDDGVHFTHVSDKPVYTPAMMGWPDGSVQDPRVVKIDGTFYMTAAVRPFAVHFGQPPGFRLERYYPSFSGWEKDNWSRTVLAASRDLVRWETLGFCTPEGVDDRDVMLFPRKIGGRYVMLHRPKDPPADPEGRHISLCRSNDLKSWSPLERVASCRPTTAWEAVKMGAAAPPIETERGWILLYHAVDAGAVYRVGALLLDREEPARVLARTICPIMEPLHDYERNGLFIPNVVFPCGAAVKDGTVYIYYGCSDSVISLATVGLRQLLDHLLLCGGGDAAIDG